MTNESYKNTDTASSSRADADFVFSLIEKVFQQPEDGCGILQGLVWFAHTFTLAIVV